MIRWSAELARRMNSGDEEKRALGPLVRRFVDLSRKTRREGFQSLEAETASIDDPLFKIGLRLVSEGLAGEPLEDILSTYLLASDEKGWPFLRACVTIEGLLSLAEGDDPDLMVRKLVAYYGADRALAALQELEAAAGTGSPSTASNAGAS
jgi:flagellar motor component MotA